MKGKLLALVAVGTLIGSSARGDDAAVEEVKKAITALNKAFETGNADELRRLMSEDHLAVTPYYGGQRSRDEQIKTLPQLKLTKYAPDNLKVTLVSKDVALVTYNLMMEGTYKERPMMPRNMASALWVKQDGKWIERYYQETALGGAVDGPPR